MTIDADDRPRRLAMMIGDLEEWGSERQWRGTDPYEGMNARRMGLLKRTPMGRRILIQLVKRSPVNLRRPLRIEPAWDSAALGHLLSSYARLHTLSMGGSRARIDFIADRLEELRCSTFSEPCWGYHFDVETRVFGYPSTMPNTIATTFVGLGLIDAHDAVGDSRFMGLAERTAEFFMNQVPRTRTDHGAYFGYFPGDRTPIHNANLLACGFLAEVARRTGRDDLRAAALEGLEFAIANQRDDGSWPYAERPGLGWIDGHHTGYVLDSVLRCMTITEDRAPRLAYERGLRFYADRLFLPDGTPKFFAERVYPIDAQCAAQAISTFALAATLEERWLERAWQVCAVTSSKLRRPDGAFAFQRGRVLANRVPHIRWVQAPMLDALTRLLWEETRSGELQ